MKKVSLATQADICTDYYLGMKYKNIYKKYGVNRWNVQQALYTFNRRTDRIKSPPRLPGSTKKKKTPKVIVNDNTDLDRLPPLKVNKNNPILEGDLDIMEKMDGVEDANDFVAHGGSTEIVIDDEGRVEYENNV